MVPALPVSVNPDARSYSLTPEGARALLRVLANLGLLTTPVGGAQ